MPCYKDEKTGTWYCQFRYADFTGKRKLKRKSGSENSICKKPRAVT